MLRSISTTRWLVIGGGVVQLLLGMMFWAGTAKALIPVHIVVGSVVTVSLFVLAIQGLRANIPVALGITGIVWAIVLPVVGGMQQSVLVGSSHWIVQVIHALLGIGAMGLASFIARDALPGNAKDSWDESDVAQR